MQKSSLTYIPVLFLIATTFIVNCLPSEDSVTDPSSSLSGLFSGNLSEWDAIAKLGESQNTRISVTIGGSGSSALNATTAVIEKITSVQREVGIARRETTSTIPIQNNILTSTMKGFGLFKLTIKGAGNSELGTIQIKIPNYKIPGSTSIPEASVLSGSLKILGFTYTLNASDSSTDTSVTTSTSVCGGAIPSYVDGRTPSIRWVREIIPVATGTGTSSSSGINLSSQSHRVACDGPGNCVVNLTLSDNDTFFHYNSFHFYDPSGNSRNNELIWEGFSDSSLDSSGFIYNSSTDRFGLITRFINNSAGPVNLKIRETDSRGFVNSTPIANLPTISNGANSKGVWDFSLCDVKKVNDLTITDGTITSGITTDIFPNTEGIIDGGYGFMTVSGGNFYGVKKLLSKDSYSKFVFPMEPSVQFPKFAYLPSGLSYVGQIEGNPLRTYMRGLNYSGTTISSITFDIGGENTKFDGVCSDKLGNYYLIGSKVSTATQTTTLVFRKYDSNFALLSERTSLDTFSTTSESKCIVDNGNYPYFIYKVSDGSYYLHPMTPSLTDRGSRIFVANSNIQAPKLATDSSGAIFIAVIIAFYSQNPNISGYVPTQNSSARSILIKVF
jgi:hypothetical protein